MRRLSSGGGSGGGRGIKSTGGNGGGGGDEGSGASGLAVIFAGYAKLMETNPWATKMATSAALNGIGDIIGQSLFEKDKPFDWLRLAKFVFLGGFFVAPILNVWYGNLNRLVPAPTTAGAITRLVLDQGLFSPIFISGFISALMLLDGAPEKIVPKLQQDLKDTVIMNWKIWVPAQFVNFRFVAPEYRLLFTNFVAVVWTTYLSWASNKDVEAPVPPPSPPKKGRR